VLGVPFEGGAGGGGGASHGPDRVRELSRNVKTISRRGRDFGDLRVLDAGDVAADRFDLAGTVRVVRRAYDEVFRTATVPVVTFGGDHSITYPIVAAAAAGRRLGLVWFDAHPDALDTYLGSRLSHGSPLRRVVDEGAVRPEDVLLVGTRAYDPGEPEFLQEVGIREIRAATFDDDRTAAFDDFRRAAAEIATRVDGLYVTVDVDVLDAPVAPATGTPVAGGIDTGTLLRLLELVPEPVVGYDVVEFAPPHDVGGVTGAAVMAVTTTILDRIAAARTGHRVLLPAASSEGR
jgi:agmatinase